MTAVSISADRIVIPAGVVAAYGPLVPFTHRNELSKMFEYFVGKNEVGYMHQTQIVYVPLPEGHKILKNGYPIDVGTMLEVAVVTGERGLPYVWIMNLGMPIDLGVIGLWSKKVGRRPKQRYVPVFDKYENLAEYVSNRLLSGNASGCYFHVTPLPDGYAIQRQDDKGDQS